MRRALLFLALALPACSTSSSGISIDVTAGQETTAFTVSPAVTSVTVAMNSLDGNINVKQTVSPDGGAFDFGEIDDTEQVSITVSGAAAGDATPVMTGASLSGLLLSSVVGAVPIFIQRTEQWARPPGGLSCSHVGGVATVLADRYLVLTHGANAMGGASTCAATGIDGYDVFGLTGNDTVAPFVPVPDTIVSLLPSSVNEDTQVLLIAATAGNTAVLYDYSTGDSMTLGPVTGLSSWADVAGGTVVQSSDGRTFVVGAGRRTGTPTTAVLEVDSDGTYGGYALSTPRLGAATTWIENTGLVVAGGSSNSKTPGLEVLGTTAAAFTSIPYPADPVVGAAAVTGGTNLVVLFGGLDGTTPGTSRALVTNCAVNCAAMPIVTSMLPPLANASAYQLEVGSQRAIVVGDDPTTGENLSFTVDYATMSDATVTPILLREPRTGATAIAAPNGTLALIGGQHLDATGTPALSVEMFAP